MGTGCMFTRCPETALDYLDSNPACRAAVLCSEGRHFCAGADLAGGRALTDTTQREGDAGHLYDEAFRLFLPRRRLSRRSRAALSVEASVSQ